MATVSNPTLISSRDIVISYPQRFFFSILSSRIKLAVSARGLVHRNPTVKCSNGSSEQGEKSDLKELLSGMVEEQVEELLNREDNKALLDGLAKAMQRVEMAKKELAEIERKEVEVQQLKNYVKQLETKASEIAECQRAISEARAMVEGAEGSLDAVKGKDHKNRERLESIKAAIISAMAGTLAGLPISLTQFTTNTQLILTLAITSVSCALFGVTFRYSIRRDLNNFQLKSGTSAAFGLVKGLATLDSRPVATELESSNFLPLAIDVAVHVSENLLIFFFAAVVLDFCIKLRVLSPFPIERSEQPTNTR